MKASNKNTVSTEATFDTIVDRVLELQALGNDTVTSFAKLIDDYGIDAIEQIAKDNYSRISTRPYVDKMKHEVKAIQVAALSEQSMLERVAFNLVDILFKVKNTTEMELGDKYLVAFGKGIGFYQYTMDRNFDKRFVFKSNV